MADTRRSDLSSAEAEEFLRARREGDVEALLGLLRHPHVRPTAVSELGRLGAVAAIPKIVPLLQGGSTHLRRSAAHALGRLRAGEAVESLFQVAFNDSDRVTREWALFAIGCIGLTEDDDRLRRLAEDSEAPIRATAIAAMLSAQNASLVEAGLHLRSQETWRMRRRIRRVGRRIETERVEPS